MSLVRNEGVLALYSGLGPAVLRGLTYGGAPACCASAQALPAYFQPFFLRSCQTRTAGVRLGAYSPVKALLSRGDESSSLLRNLTAGCISGAVAAAATNPLDLVKVCSCSQCSIRAAACGTQGAVLRCALAYAWQEARSACSKLCITASPLQQLRLMAHCSSLAPTCVPGGHG